MKIELKEIKISEVAKGYFNDNEEGVVGFEGKLNIRPKYQREFVYKDKQKREAFERQKGICVKCGVEFELSEMEADHITPWHEGGKTTADNCQMLCKHDNRIKSGK